MSSDHIKYYLNLLESNIVEEETSSDLFEEVNVTEYLDTFDNLANDLAELKAKFESFQCTSADTNYSTGFEEGMYEAAQLLENLLRLKYNRPI